MPTTPDLFSWRNFPPSVPVRTSEAAARAIAPAAAAIREEVFRCVLSREGATCDEVEAALDMRHQTASARIRELVLSGRLTDSGTTRKTRSGRNAVVWIPLAH